MTKFSRITVDVGQAAEFMALGYSVEHVVLLPKAAKPNGEIKAPYATAIPNDAILGFSPEGTAPIRGGAFKWWKALQQNYFVDPTRTYTRELLSKKLVSYGAHSNFISQLVHNYKLLRVIE